MKNNILSKNERRRKELPLIELDENKQNNLTKVTQGIKDVLASLRMPIEEEISGHHECNLIASHNDGELKVMVNINYEADRDLINFLHSRIVMIPISGNVEVDSEIIITQWFNPEELFISLRLLLANGSCYLAAVGILMSADKTPDEIMDLLDQGVQKLKDKMERDFLKKKANKLNII